MSITNIPANKNVGKSLGDINANFAYLDSENEDRKKELSDKLDKSAVDSTLSSESENPVQNKVVYAAIQNAGSKITVDNALSSTSENPVQNKVVYAAIQNAGSKITVDNALSSTSENPVQNKVVTQAINTSNQNISILKSRVQSIEDGLNPDISADFLTSEGFGNLRYYNGHFQKYDANSDTWVDTTATPDNVYIFNMVPQAVKKISGTYDIDLCKYKLKFEAPDDTIIDGQLVCIVDKIIIRRKSGSAPENENDGDLVVEIKRREFGLYKNNWFVDNTFTPNFGDVYYYKVFPVSTLGHINYSTINETRGLVCKEYTLYGFKIDQNESDPASMITYLSDCDNATYKSAHMDYTTDKFDYGDWGDAWFIEELKPCMLKYDGTVGYELDKNDYTKKANGTASDVANTDYEGNAMIGIPKVYWKIVDNGDDTANVYICNKKIDNDFVCWSHIDNNGNEIDYCYISIYISSLISGKLRSISNVGMSANLTIADQIAYAESNNVSGQNIWNIDTYCDRLLINLLLTLIGKSTNSQLTFGSGINEAGIGESNKKGIFHGYSGGGKVKIFGVEDWWGCCWRNIVGWINGANKVQLVKMTYGQSDGSTIDGYNTDGSGYVNAITLDTLNTGKISAMYFTKYGLFPKAVNGSTTTYYCDNSHYLGSAIGYTSVGGTHISIGDGAGSWATVLYFSLSNISSDVCTGISCKPLATTI